VQQCGTCQGRGVVIKMVSLGPGFMQQVQQPCDVCGGKGKIIKSKCKTCSGKKVVKGTKKLDVMVEMGMPDGHRIEFENAADEHPDHAAGHIVFTVNTLAHPRFVRKGNDLHYTQSISLLESLVGFTHSITHLDGHTVPITSTKVTQHGDVQRISKEGMPIHNRSSDKGDLFVTYEVVFPKTLTQELKAGFEKILPK
jgi:DnaJ-related protein SCJ1